MDPRGLGVHRRSRWMHPWGLGVNPSRWGRVDTGSRWVDPWGWGVDARSRRVDPRRRGVDHRCRGVDPGGWGVDAWSRGVDPRRRGVDPRSWGVDPRSWWGQLGRARRPRGCRPAGRHGWQRQASWRWWGQSLRQRRPRGQTIHQGWWGSLHSRRPRREAGRGRRLLHLEVELQEKLEGNGRLSEALGALGEGIGWPGKPSKAPEWLTCLVSRFQ